MQKTINRGIWVQRYDRNYGVRVRLGVGVRVSDGVRVRVRLGVRVRVRVRDGAPCVAVWS